MGLSKSKERALLGALVLASFAVHFATRIHGFGEPDEARIGIFALDWREAGVFSTDTYLNRTSPLYLLFVRSLLDHGVARTALADALNVANVVVGSLALIPMFVLFKKLARDAAAAFLGISVYFFAPTFFYGNCYGMPHVPALAGLLTSLALLATALEREGTPRPVPALLAAFAMAVAAGMKSDIALAALAFPGLVVLSRSVTLARLAAAAAIPVVGVGAALVISRVALPVPVSNTEFASTWNKQFPFEPRGLLAAGQLRVVLCSLGPVLWVAVAVAALALVVLRGRPQESEARDRKLVLFTLAWSLPALLFWGMIIGHSLRHLTAALCPVALLVAVGLQRLAGTPARTAGALAVVLAANYFWLRPTTHAQAGTPRLFGTVAGIQAMADQLAGNAREFAAAPASRKLLIGGPGIPTFEYALLAGARRFVRRVRTPSAVWELEVVSDGREPEQVTFLSGVNKLPPGYETNGVLVRHAEPGRTP